MIEQIIIMVAVLIVFTLGMLCSELLVWRHLRKKGHVRIDNWYYTAVKLKEGQYKRWE